MREGAIDKQQLTPYRELDEVLLDYADTCHAALRRNFVGLYLLGSLAIGDFDLTSDVDFMIVSRTELTTDEVKRVQVAHTDLLGRDSRWVRHLEYSIFSLAQLSKRPSVVGHDASPAPKVWYFINGGSVIEWSDHDNTLVTRWTLRYKSKAVLGPQPATFAPRVTADELRQEIRESMLRWEKLFTPESSFNNRFHQVFFVLNNCRALQDLHEGRITSKREGVAWAKKHLDVRWHALVDYSWRERQDSEINVSQPVDPEVFEETVGFIAYTTRLAENYELAKD